MFFYLFENVNHSKPHKWLYVFFYLFFFANFYHTTIVNLVSDFTCCLLVFHYFLNGHGLMWFYFA